MSAAPTKATERVLRVQENARHLVRGACPTLAEPMETGDGLLARLNPVSGGIAPSTLAAIAEAAARFGNGQIEVTARGSLQIRGLTQFTAPRLAEAIDGLDMNVRTGVPLETGPLAGLDPDEIADPSPLAERIRHAIAAGGLSARLGPKVSVVVDGGGRLPLDEVLADVRLEAGRRGGAVVWHVAIGGTRETARGLGFVEIEAAGSVVMALLEAIASKGKTGRAKELTDGELEAALRYLPQPDRATRSDNQSSQAAPPPPSVLPDISPSRGEIGLHGRPAQSPPLQDRMSGCGQPISPLEGEMSGRTEGGETRIGGAHFVGPASPITTLSLSDGRTALGIGLPFGQATAAQIVSFADAAMRAGADEILMAQGRSLLALCPTAEAAETLREAAAALGFLTDAADPRRSVVACAGAPACASGHLRARAIAAEIAALLPSGLDGVVHVSGCAKQCAKPARAAFTLIGTSDACEIHHGDGREGQPIASVAIGDAAAAFGRAARLYRNEKKNGKGAATRP
ncbi:precorrin-3B synthase [Mesorhizobium sp. L-8-10]|uniref:precorrin-3B synthase n=1 Tax=Mesorhizobium sp. L-8-10 TaxID=2744523 RepID=UPI00192833F3|nr:precorrin-3B synthase [Mesorhizobium sp. L-8-10]BCH35437.1 precorrin-3B synthase [Mesorhizobium sp. L-8-10]